MESVIVISLRVYLVWACIAAEAGTCASYSLSPYSCACSSNFTRAAGEGLAHGHHVARADALVGIQDVLAGLVHLAVLGHAALDLLVALGQRAGQLGALAFLGARQDQQLVVGALELAQLGVAGGDLRLGAFQHGALLLRQLLGLALGAGKLTAQGFQLLLRRVALRLGRRLGGVDLGLLALHLLQLLRGAAQLRAQLLFHAFGLRGAAQRQARGAQRRHGRQPAAAPADSGADRHRFIPYGVHVHGLRTWR
ncbi:hypothetical protein WJ968_14585 [Achromobacter xylosoxidans]